LATVCPPNRGERSTRMYTTTSCTTSSKSYNKLDNLSHSKSTTNPQLIEVMEFDNKGLKATLTQTRVRVTRISFTRTSGAFAVTCTSTRSTQRNFTVIISKFWACSCRPIQKTTVTMLCLAGLHALDKNIFLNLGK